MSGVNKAVMSWLAPWRSASDAKSRLDAALSSVAVVSRLCADVGSSRESSMRLAKPWPRAASSTATCQIIKVVGSSGRMKPVMYPISCLVWSDTATTLVAEKSRHHSSEEHTSELQSRFELVCRRLLEKTK